MGALCAPYDRVPKTVEASIEVCDTLRRVVLDALLFLGHEQRPADHDAIPLCERMIDVS